MSFPTEHSEKSALYYSYIPVIPDRAHYRKFDPASLKDIRRRLDGGYCAPAEVDQIAQDLMEDCTTVSQPVSGHGDYAETYLGNSLLPTTLATLSSRSYMRTRPVRSVWRCFGGSHLNSR
jgi:hypothetical protein